MTTRMRRRLLRWTQLLAAFALVAAVATAIHWARPLSAWTPPRVELGPAAIVASTEQNKLSLAELAVIWQRDLRQPLFDPPPSKPEPSPAPPKLGLRLVGTAVEAERRYAIFRRPDSTTVVKPLGETLDGYEITSIARGRARLRNGDRTYELRVPWYERIRHAPGPESP